MPFNLNNMYGRQLFDRKFNFNTFMVYSPPFYKGQQGLIGRVLGGWTFSPVLTAGSGAPIEIFTTTGDGQEFGAGDNGNFFGLETAVPIAHSQSGHAYKQSDRTVNIFKDPLAAASNYRNPILGIDNRNTQFLNGLAYWNLDFTIRKNVRIAQKAIALEFQSVFTDVLNHNQWLDPWGMGLVPGWFQLFGSYFRVLRRRTPAATVPVQLGARVRF